MKLFLILLVGGVVTASTLAAQTGGAVVPAQRRLDALKVADRVLTERQPGWREIVAELPDPFFRTNFAPAPADQVVVVEQAPRRVERSAVDVLRAVANEIQPEGIFIVGDDRYLLLRGKRIKVGDSLTVTFEGLVHHVVISSIEKNVYTLRLHDQELRREFK